MKEIIIKTEFIKLGQFLKFVGEISNGADAKLFLENNLVLVNGEKETRRGRKIYKDYSIKVLANEYIIKADC